MSAQQQSPPASRWSSSPRLWGRWWADRIQSGRDALRSLWEWFTRKESPPPVQRRQQLLSVEVLEERNHPDDLASLLGISFLGVLFGSATNPLFNPAVLPVQPADSTPGREATPTNAIPRPLGWDWQAFTAGLAAPNATSSSTTPPGSPSQAAATLAGGEVDPLIARLLFDLDQFQSRSGSGTPGASQSTGGGSSGSDSVSNGIPGSDSSFIGPALAGAGTMPEVNDPFAWANALGLDHSVQAGTTPGTPGPHTQVVAPQGPGSTTTTTIGNEPSARGIVPSTLDLDFGRLAVTFESNAGQTDDSVHFLSRGVGQTLFLTGSEAVLSLAGPRPDTDPRSRLPGQPNEPGTEPTGERALNDVLRLGFVGSNANPTVRGIQELDTRSNYFIGNDRSKWHSDVANYGGVVYEDLYDGIDLVWKPSEMSSRQFQFDYHVASGKDV